MSEHNDPPLANSLHIPLITDAPLEGFDPPLSAVISLRRDAYKSYKGVGRTRVDM
jgi:hypothetical protein